MTHADAQSKPPLPLPATLLSGAFLGLAWGIVARLWMRLIATTPEFSLPGTAAILTIATLFGACASLAFAARQRGWQRWGHYVPRGLTVLFFLPFGIAGGLPLMLTVLAATLGLTQRALVCLWTLASLVTLVALATDIAVPPFATIGAPASAIALTAWKWLLRRAHATPRLQAVDLWLERLGRALLLLLAVAGLFTVTSGILADKPGLPGIAYSLFYLALLCPLYLALRLGLAPRTPLPASS